MANEQSDVTLITILPNAVFYQRPVDDPFFSAHRPFECVTYDGRNETC